MGVSSLPKTVTRQRRDCDLNPGPSAPKPSTLSTRLPSHYDLLVEIVCNAVMSSLLNITFAHHTDSTTQNDEQTSVIAIIIVVTAVQLEYYIIMITI